jgi:hypothetical protein
MAHSQRFTMQMQSAVAVVYFEYLSKRGKLLQGTNDFSFEHWLLLYANYLVI